MAKKTMALDAKIARTVDEMGRIVLPKLFRKELFINEGEELLVSIEGNKLIVEKMSPFCKMCGATENLDSRIGLCKDCIDNVKAL